MHGVLGATRNRTEARGAPFTLCPILPQRASIRAGSARCSAIFSQVKRRGLLFCSGPHSAPATSALRRSRSKHAPAASAHLQQAGLPRPRRMRAYAKRPSISATSWPSAPAANTSSQQTALRIRNKRAPAAGRLLYPLFPDFSRKCGLCNIGSVLKSRNVAFLTQNRLWMTRDCHSKRFERSRAVTKRPFFGNIGD